MDLKKIRRLWLELDALRIRTDKLEKFIDSKEFKILDEENKGLLKNQLTHMESYREILIRRVNLTANTED